MTLEDWASRLSIQEVHTRVVRLQKSSLTLQDDSNSASDIAHNGRRWRRDRIDGIGY